jgi:hypothetical protein
MSRDTTDLSPADIYDVMSTARCAHGDEPVEECTRCTMAAIFHRSVYRRSRREGLSAAEARAVADNLMHAEADQPPVLAAIPEDVGAAA